MKTIKSIYFTAIALLLFISCSEELANLDFAKNIPAPTNVNALFEVKQDNTGDVTITPSGDNIQEFEVNFGDGTTENQFLSPGESAINTYTEGEYTVTIIGHGMNKQKTENTLPLNVSFKAPENLEVTMENDLAISKQVNVTATADYAISFDVYFGEDGVDTPVTANIGETASYVYQEAGTYNIRVVAKGAAIATTETIQEFTATAIVQPVESAPTPPSRNPADVISIYGDAYQNLTNVNVNPDWGQSGQGSSFTEFDLDGDKMLQYINLSYQGIEFGETVDASSMDMIHMDVWTADVTDLEISLINTTGEKPITKALTADQWNTIEIPLTDYTDQGLTINDLIQIKLVGTPWAGGTVFVDNIYFFAATASAPSTDAPTPTIPSSIVTSIFSDSYDNVGISELNPNWGQSTTLSTVVIETGNTWKYENLNFTGIVTDYANPTDLSNRTHVHFNYWTTDATSLALKIVNTSYGDGDPNKEAEVAVPSITYGEWVSVSIPLTDFTTDMSGITQFLYVSSGATVFIDNFYFYTELTDAPTTAAANPTENSADVISIFSDAYTPIATSEWNPGWGQSTVLETVQIEANNILKYSSLNFTGIVTDYANPTDVSSKTHVHFDYWTNDATTLGYKLVNTSHGNGDPLKEAIVWLPSVGLGSWQSVDIPLTDFTTDMTGITQMLFESSGATVYIDNLYFY